MCKFVKVFKHRIEIFSMKERLDEKDFALLQELKRNARASLRSISRKLGMPISTVHVRMKKLEKLGVIKQYTAVIDEKKLGFNVKAFVLVSYQRGYVEQETTAKKLASLPFVKRVYIITGEWDILLEVVARDIEELGDFVVKRIRKVPGVEKTLTLAVLKRVKELE